MKRKENNVDKKFVFFKMQLEYLEELLEKYAERRIV